MKLIVTHHAPDLDAIAAVWLFKRFDSQTYADAKVAFVSPGEKISEYDRAQLHFNEEEVTHVDTGLGEFDHHQAERAREKNCAASLIFDHLSQLHPELIQDQALKTIINFAIEIDHFQEIYWPNPSDERYKFMIHELISGLEKLEYHDNDSMLHFGMTCLDAAYQNLKDHFKAISILEERKIIFTINAGQVLAIATNNDQTIKLAQKQGYVIAVRKDPDEGHMRIKARPDSKIDLRPLYDKILELDHEGDWFYHQGGKMLLNGSGKSQQVPTPLSLEKIIELIKEIYG